MTTCEQAGKYESNASPCQIHQSLLVIIKTQTQL